MTTQSDSHDAPDAQVLERLYRTIESRKGASPEESYTAKLLASGAGGIGKKIAEESLETVCAALTESGDRVAAESADLLYHLLVLWAAAGVEPDQVWAELARREGRSGIAEKASRDPKA